jgi:hypothetical protein
MASKVRKRKENYKKRTIHFNALRSWRILILVMKAVKIFLDKRRYASIAASLPPNFGILEPYFVPSNCIGFENEGVETLFPLRHDVKDRFDEFKIVKDVVKKLLSKICRRECERMRQLKIREKKKISIANQNGNEFNLKQSKQRNWFREKYRQNAAFRQEKIRYVKDYFRKKYKVNKDFHVRHNSQMKNKYQTNNGYHESLKFHMRNKYRMNNEYFEKQKNQKWIKYHLDSEYREKRKKELKNKYHTNSEHREKRKHQLKNRYHANSEYREKRKSELKNKYRIDEDFRLKRKLEIKRKYQIFKDYREKRKIHMKRKYHMYLQFREEHKAQMKSKVLEKYHTMRNFRDLYIIRAKRRMLKKYHNDKQFREEYKRKVNQRLVEKYNSNSSIRLKKINHVLRHYRTTYTPLKQNQRRLYNQSRRILKKYKVNRSHYCKIQHRNLYLKYLKEFRKKNQEGPDYVCISCRLALFRNQVIPYVEQKYIKKDMPYEMREKIQSFVGHPLITDKKWICRYCSDKIKKEKMPSRCISNKLELSDVPIELKKLNDLERHLIALRLPFLKIINLTSGKISGRFAQKGTKGPLHCVPSDVQETVTTLPRPIDKSLMIRLQLKRRLKYKAVWEEQLINPNDVRNALIILTKKHPGYRNVNINEIDDNYLTSDKRIDNNIEGDEIIEPMDVDLNNGENLIEQVQMSNEERIQRLALGEIEDDDHDDDEVNEDIGDIRTKYNIGTDSCTQPADFNDFLFYNKEPCAVAPAEKNNLCSLLTDKSIEGLAFPHLFPDGKGTYDEERATDLKWKEYCKTRLFSSDSRFASDSSYIFYLQYLGDLKQVFSSFFCLSFSSLSLFFFLFRFLYSVAALLLLGAFLPVLSFSISYFFILLFRFFFFYQIHGGLIVPLGP